MSSVFVFHDAHDRESASDGASRYGYYLRQRRNLFADWDDPQAITADPVAFTQIAWEIGNSPIMAPAYIDWDAERLQTVTCHSSEYDGTLIARISLAVPRPAELRGLRGFREWQQGRSWGGPSGYFTPDDDQLTRSPALLTSTVLLLAIPTDQLHVPTDAPSELTVRDAKAAVKRLGALLDERLSPVLKALG